MIDTKALKQKILDLAIHGKLVPQDPSDEPASALLEKIRAEKQRLIKEGKIKSDKSDSVIYKGDYNRYYEKIGDYEPKCIDAELPFAIPNSWRWVRHNEIFEISGGSQPPKSKFITNPKNGYIRLYQIKIMSIAKHKVFISYYHQDDQWYKNRLLVLNDYYNIFDDYSVHEDEIDDTGMTSEQIRREIRDNYIQDATVLVLLCGENTKRRKHIDWEIHAAMYDSDTNPKMGILVINLPTITSEQTMIASGTEEQNLMAPFATWTPLDKSRTSLEEKHPYLPSRIITNLMRDDVQISLVNWDVVANNPEKLKQLIDNAFERRKSNNYDHSEPLRRNNS